MDGSCHTRRKRPGQSAECRYADCRRRKAVTLHRYVLRYRHTGKLRVVRTDEHTVSRQLVADEHRNDTVYHGYAGIGGADILYLSQDSLYHQRGVNGRLFGSYTVGSDISGNSNVCTDACGVLPVSGTALHRSGTGYDLFRCGVCLFLAIGGCTTGIPAAGHTDSAFIEVVDTEDEGKRRNSPYRRQSIVRHCSDRYTVRYIIRYIARHGSNP